MAIFVLTGINVPMQCKVRCTKTSINMINMMIAMSIEYKAMQLLMPMIVVTMIDKIQYIYIQFLIFVIEL